MSDQRDYAAKRAGDGPKATAKQQKFLMSMLEEQGFGTHLRRANFLQRNTHRDINYVDELRIDEASAMIETLRQQSASARAATEEDVRRRHEEGEESDQRWNRR